MDHSTPTVHFIATRRGPSWVGEVIDLRTQATLYRSARILQRGDGQVGRRIAMARQAAAAGDHALRRRHDGAAALLRCCSLDFRTVRNMREHMIPALRAAGTYSEEEVDRGVAEFERRVAQSAQQVAA